MWSPYWSILVCKIPQFWARLPIQTMHHTFLESRHPEVTKNPYYVLSREWSQKKVSAHGLKVIGVSDVLTWVACYYYCYCYYRNTDNLEKKLNVYFWDKNEKIYQIQIDLNSDLKKEPDLKSWCYFTLIEPVMLRSWISDYQCGQICPDMCNFVIMPENVWNITCLYKPEF